MVTQYRSEYDPATGTTKQVVIQDGVEVGTYGTGADSGVSAPTSGTVSPDNEVIGAGPNAGLTPAEVEARDAANPDAAAAAGGTTTPITQNPGESLADYQARLANRPVYLATGGELGPGVSRPVALSTAEGQAIAKKYGIEGVGYSFAGMTATQAEAKAKEVQKKHLEQTSSLTSYAYDPSTISGTKKAADDLALKLNEITNNSWYGNGTKTDKINTQLAVTANDIAKNWTNTDSFLKDFTTNPDIQKNLDAYIKAGGTKEQIVAAIAKNNQPDLSNVDQTTADYMANLTTAEKAGLNKAAESILPEAKLAQDEISRIAGIPADLQKLYFGSEEQIGLYDKKITEATESKRIIEQKEADAKTSLEAKAKLLKEKNIVDANKTLATIEKNRLAAKNYTTGMLAKLGALNTTSAAVDSITTLDEKYQAQATEIQSNLDYNNSVLDQNLNNDINDVTNATDEKILSIEEDLSKSGTDMIKEVMKAKQDAQKDIYSISSKYADKFVTLKDKYTKEYQTAADKYARDYAKTVSNNLDLKSLSASVEGGGVYEGEYVPSQKGILLPDGTYKKISLTNTQANAVQVAKIVGEDTIRYYLTLPSAFKQVWQQKVDATKDDTTRYSVKALRDAYAEWSKKKTSSSSSSGTREI